MIQSRRRVIGDDCIARIVRMSVNPSCVVLLIAETSIASCVRYDWALRDYRILQSVDHPINFATAFGPTGMPFPLLRRGRGNIRPKMGRNRLLSLARGWTASAFSNLELLQANNIARPSRCI